jgi:hypothetical protein
MPLDPLATTDDLAVRLGRELTETETAQAEALLAGASQRVRTYTGLDFTLVEDDTAQIKVRNGIGRLPQRPVVAVTSVDDLNSNTVTFTWLGDDLVRLSPLVDSPWLYEAWRNPIPEVTVTYDHGYEDIPADVIDVVCSMAARSLSRGPDSGAIQSESIAGYSYTLGATAAAGTVGLLNDEKAALDVYRRRGGSIRLSA